jgi:hypothetical protein
VHASAALLMRARHPSVCERCGRDIRAGDEIVRDRGPWVHRECSQAYQEMTRRTENADSLRSYEEMLAHERRLKEEEEEAMRKHVYAVRTIPVRNTQTDGVLGWVRVGALAEPGDPLNTVVYLRDGAMCRESEVFDHLDELYATEEEAAQAGLDSLRLVAEHEPERLELL